MTPYWSDNLVTLYLGDCREILPELDPVDLVLADPPYGVTYASNWNVGPGSRPITNDGNGARLALRLQRAIIPTLRTQHVLWFTRWDAWPDLWLDLGAWYPLRGLLVWDKGSPGMGDLAHWGPSYELIASAGTGKTAGSRDQSVLRYPTVPSAKRHHPTEKPTSLLEYLIRKLDAATVLDPFAGAGSTLVAARNLGRRAVGVEIDERYAERAARRLDQGVLELA